MARGNASLLAISDIFGGNAFLPVLFLPATLLSGKAVLPEAQETDIYLTAVGIVLTAVYVTGLLFRPTRRIAGMGIDSFVVLRALRARDGWAVRNCRQHVTCAVLAPSSAPPTGPGWQT